MILKSLLPILNDNQLQYIDECEGKDQHAIHESMHFNHMDQDYNDM